MQENPLVSVCIQTYQHSGYIAAAIESVLAQETDFPFEIIIGEDDSTDGTREICLRYAEVYPDLIRLFLRKEADKIHIRGKKTGRFNFLQNLKAARGTYIALLDGDDCWTDHRKLQQQVDFLQQHPGLSICTHRYIKQFSDGRSELPVSEYWKESPEVYPADSLIKEYYAFMSAVMFPAALVKDLPSWFLELPFTDYPLMIYLSQYGPIGYLPGIMTRYNIHAKGMWSAAKAPENDIRLWDVLSLMALHLKEDYAKAMEAGRERIGKKLVGYYRTHAGKDRSWLIRELSAGRFAADQELLKELQRSRTPRDYGRILINTCKETGRQLWRKWKYK